jgi:hypothetical protein
MARADVSISHIIFHVIMCHVICHVITCHVIIHVSRQLSVQVIQKVMTSLERSLLVFSTPGGPTGDNLSPLFFTCTNTSQAATCTCNT